jgi:DNA-binding NtrC family response regulator
MSATASNTVLVIDVDAARSLIPALRDQGFEVLTARDDEHALHTLDEAPIACLVTPLAGPRLDGMKLLRHARARDPEAIVIVLADESAAVERVADAVREGAYDVLPLPAHAGRVLALVERGFAHRRLAARVADMEIDLEGRLRLGGLDGRSRAVARVLDQIRTVGASRAPVLIEGEDGTGKSLVALSLHAHSELRDQRFLRLHCGSLPADELERELFGEEADGGRSRPGRVELADGGTLFLEEVGEAPPRAQLRLLRLLQDRESERVGGSVTRRIIVRLVCSTSRDLAGEVAAGRIRADLLERIAVVRIAVPPLRERREDVPFLVQAAIRSFNREHGRRITGITRGALERLVQHGWPGNVRELRTAIEGMVVAARGRRRLDLSDLPPALRDAGPRGEDLRLAVGMTIEEVERQLLLATLIATGNDKRRAASMLGIGLRTLYRKIARYGA